MIFGFFLNVFTILRKLYNGIIYILSLSSLFQTCMQFLLRKDLKRQGILIGKNIFQLLGKEITCKLSIQIYPKLSFTFFSRSLTLKYDNTYVMNHFLIIQLITSISVRR